MMYPNKGIPEIDVGAFRLRQFPEIGHIWIERIGGDAAGEGGSFPLEMFESVIKEFYDENF